MKKLRTILVACALSAGVAACDSHSVVGSDAPPFDAAYGTASTDTTSAVSAERGGPFTVGSGN